MKFLGHSWVSFPIEKDFLQFQIIERLQFEKQVGPVWNMGELNY